MITAYLNQTARYERLLSDDTDIYGDGGYHPPVTVRCRAEPRIVETQDRAGRIAVTERVYFLAPELSPRIGEMLDGRKILMVEQYIDGAGVRVGWEVHV